MEPHWSKELIVVADESRDLADKLGHVLTTGHLLLVLYSVENRAAQFLVHHTVTLDRLLDALKTRPTEPHDAWDRVLRRGREVASVSRAAAVSSLHVLVAMTSFVDCAAYQILVAAGADVGALRARALAEAQGTAGAFVDVAAPGLSPTRHREVADPELVVSARAVGPGPVHPTRPLTPGRDSGPTSNITSGPAAGPAGGPATSPATGAAANPSRPAAPVAAPQRPEVPTSTGAQRPTADSDPTPDAPTTADEPREPADVRRLREERARAEQKRMQDERRLAARVFGQPQPGAPPGSPAAARPAPASARPASTPTAGAATAPLARQAAAPVQPRSQLRARFVLRENQFPLLARLGRNLTLMAFDNELDRVVGRDREIEQLVDILNKRRANNPVLVGEPGVGKTAVVEGLARRIAGVDSPASPPPGLDNRIVVELDASRMVSGTSVRGSFAARMQALKAEVARAQGQVIVFLDELHHWIGMGGSADGAQDGAGELKTALARGEFPCIGATTFDEYRRFIETDPAFERRFQTVRVDEPSAADTITILGGVSVEYGKHHAVAYTPASIEAAVRLTTRYLPDRRLPDKAISALDLAGSRARRLAATEVDAQLVAAVVAEQAGLPPDKVLMLDTERFNGLDKRLSGHIVGHTAIVERVASVLRRNHAGFVSGRPIGSFLLLGPTGVGKTELAKAVAQALFDDTEALVRIDMTEFMEAHSVARLIGSPPGYVGHDAGGQLTEAIRRRPYQVVLFDEVEKAHPDVLNILIQLLDEGRLTDSRGRMVDFTSAVVFLTSNLGADEALGRSRGSRIGFGGESAGDEARENAAALAVARAHFRPEIWNRLDETLVFSPLQRADVAAIAELLLRRSSDRLHTERQIRYAWTPAVIDHLIEHGGWDPTLGARPMRRTIERLIESLLADRILLGQVSAGAELRLDVHDGAIDVAAV